MGQALLYFEQVQQYQTDLGTDLSIVNAKNIAIYLSKHLTEHEKQQNTSKMLPPSLQALLTPKSLDLALNLNQQSLEYLYLPEINQCAHCIISMAPLNSSGDFYHILAYLILARAHNKKFLMYN